MRGCLLGIGLAVVATFVAQIAGAIVADMLTERLGFITQGAVVAGIVILGWQWLTRDAAGDECEGAK